MPHANFRAGRLDVSARAGVLLGAHASGTSYQPNLLSRASRDQALIAGVSASTTFGVGTATHSFLRSLANRLPNATQTTAGRVRSGLFVDGLAAAAGLIAVAALKPTAQESAGRSLARLAATTTRARPSPG